MKVRIDEVELRGKRVFLRVDFNVPFKDGSIEDDSRIRAALATMKRLRQEGAKTVLATHLGRPKASGDPEFSTQKILPRVNELMGGGVGYVGAIAGEEVEERKAALKPGEFLLLENVRYDSGETKNDPRLAQELAKNIDVYVNDAFSCSHRAHSSVVGISRFVPLSVMGYLISAELEYLGMALNSPRHPFAALLGGAKINDKIPVLESLVERVDTLLIGGGMAYTFLKARGEAIGSSLLDGEHLETVGRILARAKERGVDILLPVDHVVAREVKEDAQTQVVEGAIPNGLMGVDIGPKSRKLFREKLLEAAMVIWNGPMGVFEMAPFAEGTRSVAEALAESKGCSIVGGGDTASAALKAGVAGKMSHISTGGGASLEFLSGDTLPGIDCLKERA